MPKLNPRQAGGIEPVEALPYALRAATAATMADLEALSDGDEEEEEEEDDDDEDEDTPMASTSKAEPAPAANAGSATLAKGLGRIIRDENGKVIKIVLGGDDGQEVEEEVKERVERDSDEEDDDDESDEEGEEPKPWGEPMKDWSNDNVEFEEEEILGPRTTGQGIPIFGGVRRSVEAKTDVVRGESTSFSRINNEPELILSPSSTELEHLAASQRKVIRHTSEFEGDWLVSLVAKYGEDLDKMARDRKANVWQKTSGEIKRMYVLSRLSPRSRMKADLARRSQDRQGWWIR